MKDFLEVCNHFHQLFLALKISPLFQSLKDYHFPLLCPHEISSFFQLSLKLLQWNFSTLCFYLLARFALKILRNIILKLVICLQQIV